MHNTYSRKFILPEQQKIIDFLNSIEFTGYYKNNSISAIDQKCTFDILNVNAKCVLNFYNNKNKKEFKINDFFDDEYSRKIYEDKTSSNGKAILRNETSKEYDKIFGNILETLSYVEILFKNYKGNERIYSINDRNVDILKILASSEEACVAFICHFVWLLVKDDKEIITHLNNLKIDEYDNNIKDKFKESTINWLKKKFK